MTPALIELIDVFKTFQVGSCAVAALDGVSFSIARGEMVTLQGPSGSGKSTLLNILGLLETPSRGKVLLGGNDLGGLDDWELTRLRRIGIGFIFQNFNLVPVLTAQENVEYPLYLEGTGSRHETRERAMAMLEAVGLARFADHKPSQLSGGQRQRVAIARAMVKRPRLILADEPTANLDSKTAWQILELLQKLRAELSTTIIMATHDREVAAIAQRTIQLKDGKLVDATSTVVRVA